MYYRKRIEDLRKWRSSSGRKPLIVRGARQVGKTTLVTTFGKEFKQFLHLNLEKPRDASFFHSYMDAKELAQQLFLEHQLDFKLYKETLLFIDEIQEVPKAVNMLRYFYEELPDLPVITAGSMLETMLGKSVSFPVGRVSYLMLRPMSFEEFLLATCSEAQLDAFQQVPIPRIAENLFLQKFTFYAFLGGMPAVVKRYLETEDITQLKEIFDELLQSYIDDAEKYAESPEQLRQLRFVIQLLGKEAGSRISLTSFGGMTYPSKVIAEIFALLEKTHLCKLVYPTVGQLFPLETDVKKAPRLHFLDTGLMNFVANIQVDVLRTDDLCSIYKGKMIEHLIGQELFSTMRFPSETPHFWVRQSRGSQAELDYLYPYDGKLYPIEVKSGKTGTLKSLFVYMETAPVSVAIRIYGGGFSVDELKTSDGKRFLLLNIPFYHATKIDEYLKWVYTDYKLDDSISVFSEPMAEYKISPVKRARKKDDVGLLKQKKMILEACIQKPLSARFLLEDLLGISFQTHNKRKYLLSLIDEKYLIQTELENKKSRYQMYRTTEKGKEFLKN